MEQVVLAEGHCRRQHERQVRCERGESVCDRRPEDEVVRALVDEHPQRVIDGGASDVRNGQPDVPGLSGEHERDRELREDEGRDPGRRQRVRTGKLTKFGMGREHLAPAEDVRIVIRHMMKIRRLHGPIP